MNRPKPSPLPVSAPTPTPEELAWMYRVGARSRCVEEHIVRLVTRGEVKFAIWGVGEEVHDLAAGDAACFLVDVAHSYENPGRTATLVHNVIVYAR